MNSFIFKIFEESSKNNIVANVLIGNHKELFPDSPPM